MRWCADVDDGTGRVTITQGNAGATASGYGHFFWNEVVEDEL